ncbi:MAG: ribonuclease D [Nannocystaceae bacterium]
MDHGDAHGEPEAWWVADDAAMARLVERLAAARVTALDTESNGMYAWRERVCLLQVSLPGLDAVVDVLAISPAPLQPWLADPGCLKILHAADNDIVTLRRDFGLSLCHVFDTMLAARALAWPQRGLADLLATRLGVRSDKRWQKFDWSRRPLPAEALDYARTDTRHLPALRAQQLQELAQLDLDGRDRQAWLQHACERSTRLQPRPRSFDPDGWVRIDGAARLDDAARSVLAALWCLRERFAEELDRAPYRVAGDAVLLAIAQRQPADPRASRPSPASVGRWHTDSPRACDAIARAKTEPPPPAPPSTAHARDRAHALRGPAIVAPRSRDRTAARARSDPGQGRARRRGRGRTGRRRRARGLRRARCVGARAPGREHARRDRPRAVIARCRDQPGAAAPATTRSRSISSGADP